MDPEAAERFQSRGGSKLFPDDDDRQNKKKETRQVSSFVILTPLETFLEKSRDTSHL